MTNADIIVNLATMIAEQRLEISELKTEVDHLHHELIATMSEADTPQTDLVKESPSLVKDLVNAFCEDGTWLERQGVYTLTLAEAKQRAVDIIEAVSRKDTADTPQTETKGAGYCNECKWFRDKQVCGRCRSRNLFAKADTPQKEDEIVLDPSFAELSDEQFVKAMKLIEPQTDCGWK